MNALILATTGCGALLSWLLKLSTKERRTLVIEIEYKKYNENHSYYKHEC